MCYGEKDRAYGWIYKVLPALLIIMHIPVVYRSVVHPLRVLEGVIPNSENMRFLSASLIRLILAPFCAKRAQKLVIQLCSL